MKPERKLPESPLEDERTSQAFLLSVDAGVKTGLALYNDLGELVWYRSHNMGSLNSLKKAARHLLRSINNLTLIAVEGGGPVCEAWIKESVKLNLKVIRTDAGEWRKAMLYPREYRNSMTAKQTAVTLAKQIIEQSSAPSANIPGHDAAEAILIGLWACREAGFSVEPRFFRSNQVKFPEKK